MINDLINATGELNILVLDENGNPKDSRLVKNLVVTVGKNYIASRMQDALTPVMSYMAVGSGMTMATVSDMALQSEITRVGTPNFTAGPGASPNIVQYVGTFGPGVGTGAITEAGIFNAASAGIMLARTVFSVVNKAVGDSVIITWNVTIS